MVLLRTIARWSLLLLAAFLTLLAATVVALRMGVLNQPALQRHLLEALGLPDRLMVHYQDLEITLEGLDVIISLEDARVADRRNNGRPMLGVAHLQARLDTLASLQRWQPVTTDVVIRGADVDLYRLPSGGWGWWPGRQDSHSGGGLAPEQLSSWVDQLLGQRGVLREGRLTFHDGDRRQTLMVPQLTITHPGQGAHLQGSANLAGQDQAALSVVGEFANRQALTGQLQLTVDAAQAGRLGQWLLAGFEETPWHLDEVSGKLRLWANWQQGAFDESRFDLDLQSLAMGRGDHDLTLTTLAGRGLLVRDESDRWHGWINQLKARPANSSASLLPNRLSLEAGSKWDTWHFRIAGFDLAPLDRFLPLLPLEGDTHQAVVHLKPSGSLNGIALDYDGQWHVRAGLVNVTTHGYDNVPGIGPISGWLEGTPRQGVFTLSGQRATFDLPGVFPVRWQLSKLETRLTWQGNDTGYTLRGEDLRVTRDQATARGSFAFLLPSEGPRRFNLDLELRNVHGDQPRNWLPLNALDPEARQWLSQHLHRADVPRATIDLGLILNKRQASGQDRIRVSLDARNASVDYLDGWPALTGINGHLEIHGETIDAKLDHAILNGLVSRGARVHLNDNRLTVSAAVGGDAGAMLDVLKSAPLEASLADTIASWRAHGPLIGMLNVTVPLDRPEEARVDGNIRLDQVGVYFRQSDLTVTDISGRLAYRYRNEQSNVTGKLTAHVFDSVSHVNVDLGNNRITAHGHAMAAGVAGWLGIETIIPLISGGVDYTASLDLEAGGPIVNVHTSLKGLSLQLPPPFQKAPDLETPLSLKVNLGKGSGTLQVADRVKARWRNDSHQGQVWLQHWPSKIGDWPAAQHWEVYWRAERIDLQAWQTAISRLGDQSSRQGPSMRTRAPAQKVAPIEHIVVRTDCLSMGVQCIGSMGATATARGNDWHAEMEGSFLKGSVDWRDRPNLPIHVHLSRLDISPFLRMGERSKDDRDDDASAAEKATNYAPGLKNLPPGRISIDRLLMDKTLLGKLSAQWQASEQRLGFSSIALQMPDATVSGQVNWEASGSDRSLTTARLKLNAEDLGKTLKSFSLPDAIHTEQGQANAKLAWPGAPWQFAIPAITGQFDVNLGNGRITAINSDLARVVSLLNLDNLFERLRLNFSDVTHSGISFRSLKGDATLYQGRLETRGPIQVAGSATHFTLNGQVNLMARTLDGQLGVTVPVTQNLPLAAVAIGAPQVGGVLWLFHELFEPWLSRVSRIYYHVWGPWASPQIKLEDAQ